MNDASVPFTVYYVVGLPRTGSTFVGDWIARHLNALNAGEVWQTFRSLGLVHEPGPVRAPNLMNETSAIPLQRSRRSSDALSSHPRKYCQYEADPPRSIL